MSQIRSPIVRPQPSNARRGVRSATTSARDIRGALRTRPAIVSLASGVAGLALFTLLLVEAVLHDHAGWPAWIGYAALFVPQVALAALAVGVTPLLRPGAPRDRAALAGCVLGAVTIIGIVAVGVMMLLGPLSSYLA